VIVFQAPGHTPTELVELATGLPGHMKWAVLMAGGGHFAAALFDGLVGDLRL